MCPFVVTSQRSYENPFLNNSSLIDDKCIIPEEDGAHLEADFRYVVEEEILY